jgi:hypothetical protein
VARGAVAGRNDRVRPERADGYGWSVLDLGRLLVWLKIIERADPEHAQLAAEIVERLDMDRLIADGYLQGGGITTTGRVRTYQEGRIGYEQYAAAGFALWDARAERALSWKANVEPATVLGVPILVDKRSTNWSDNRQRNPKVKIEAGAVVNGTLRFEREVDLYVSPSATVGSVEGVPPVRHTLQ